MTNNGLTAIVSTLVFGSILASSSPLTNGDAAEKTNPKLAAAIGHPSFLSPHASPIALNRNRVFVVNTPSDTVDVIDKKTRKVVARIDVGIDPVGIAVRPDGKEIWVTNHVSDSVSIIDTDPASPTYLQIIATIQEFDFKAKSTRFDEPVGIAFANNDKAYVALSSENKIAVINVATRKVDKRLNIPAQDPRAIVVRGDRLYVIPFESNNKTQLSGGTGKIDGNLVTFDANEHSIANNNVLSLGHVTDIVKHPRVPDRDLFIFDTKTDELVDVIDTLGTLLYGLTVDSNGRVFIAQTDARNDANGRSGSRKHGLAELENRAFFNQITSVKLGGKPKFFNLEPLPPKHPEKGKALATPFAIQISDDDSTLVVSAASSDKIFTVDTKTGDVLGRVEVDSVPRGIALESVEGGGLSNAWVLNAVANSVSLVDVSNPAKPKVTETIALQDSTLPEFKRGRIAFNKAAASTTQTFSCASCHPDGHTDQLLWVLKTPIVTGGNQIMPRSTMPVRGLRDTAPYHWDGIPGDPYGGNNSANTRIDVAPNSSLEVPESTTRHLIDAGLASTMARVGSKQVNDEGKEGLLTGGERDAMSKFLLSVTYPPAQKRAYNNVLSKKAQDGFERFHIKGNVRSRKANNVCGNCHRMPFWVSTNTPRTGMDAPTWRGAYDRFLILPQGRLNIIDFDFYRRLAREGVPERKMWQRSWRKQEFDTVWDMVLEGSTGFSGSFARQVTLNKATAELSFTNDLLRALETSSGEGGIVLQSEGVLIKEAKGAPIKLQFNAEFGGGAYVRIDGDRKVYTREELVKLASKGEFVGTFTGRHGENACFEHPQPALWTISPIQKQSGRQKFPIVYPDNKTMTISGRHIRDGASLVVNGRKVPGTIRTDEEDKVMVKLKTLPSVGMHFLQVQNPNGLFSNDFIFNVVASEEKARRLKYERSSSFPRDNLAKAIEKGDLNETRKLLYRGAPLNSRRIGNGGMTPLSTAVFHGRYEIVKYLVERRKASVSHHNRDGNTPLHLAAFLGRMETVKYLLEKGASVTKKNDRKDTAIDIVSSSWSDRLARRYTSLSDEDDLNLDLEEIKRFRPQIVKLLNARK
jgi:YVTN family beta-propeller protein